MTLKSERKDEISTIKPVLLLHSRKTPTLVLLIAARWCRSHSARKLVRRVRNHDYIQVKLIVNVLLSVTHQYILSRIQT